MKTVIGLDIGRSTTKVTGFDGVKSADLLFPSQACRAIRISDEVEAGRASLDTVNLDGAPWFFGDTALLQGRHLVDSLQDDWIFTEEHTALFLGALYRLRQSMLQNVDSALIVMGLPGRTYSDQHARLRAHVQGYAPGATIKIVPQPAGPYYQMMFDAQGNEVARDKINTESWGIVEVGHYTTDFSLYLAGGRFIQDGLDSCNGFRVAVQELQRIVQAKYKLQIDGQEAIQAFLTGVLHDFGKTIPVGPEIRQATEAIVQQVRQYASRILADRARQLTGIILAGGGAGPLYPSLKQLWPNTVLLPNPQFAVATGFVRFGIGYGRYLEQSLKRQA